MAPVVEGTQLQFWSSQSQPEKAEEVVWRSWCRGVVRWLTKKVAPVVDEDATPVSEQAVTIEGGRGGGQRRSRRSTWDI